MINISLPRQLFLYCQGRFSAGKAIKLLVLKLLVGKLVSSSGQYSMSSTTTSQTSFPTSSDSFSVSQGMIGVIQTVNTIPPEVYFSIQDNTFNSGFPINVIGVVKRSKWYCYGESSFAEGRDT